jgi:hypothetical protein
MAVKKLSQHVSQFTRIPTISIKIKQNSWTYSVFPIYTNDLPSPFKKNNKPADVHKYIDKVYFVVGSYVIDTLSQKELTAILLHELGHVDEHTSTLMAMMSSIVGEYSQHGTTISLIIPFIWLLLPVFILTSHVARLYDRLEEYKSDNYATINGYGEEMAKALYKLKQIDDKQSLSKNKNMGILDKVKRFIMNFLYPPEFPSDKKRICRTINSMLDDYKKQYPDLKQDMHVMFSDLKCR